ncbi:MAG: hypothetical protein ABI831_20650, partial [Betaproteobacteria bacterium]
FRCVVRMSYNGVEQNGVPAFAGTTTIGAFAGTTPSELSPERHHRGFRRNDTIGTFAGTTTIVT